MQVSPYQIKPGKAHFVCRRPSGHHFVDHGFGEHADLALEVRDWIAAEVGPEAAVFAPPGIPSLDALLQQFNVVWIGHCFSSTRIERCRLDREPSTRRILLANSQNKDLMHFDQLNLKSLGS